MPFCCSHISVKFLLLLFVTRVYIYCRGQVVASQVKCFLCPSPLGRPIFGWKDLHGAKIKAPLPSSYCNCTQAETACINSCNSGGKATVKSLCTSRHCYILVHNKPVEVTHKTSKTPSWSPSPSLRFLLSRFTCYKTDKSRKLAKFRLT